MLRTSYVLLVLLLHLFFAWRLTVVLHRRFKPLSLIERSFLWGVFIVFSFGSVGFAFGILDGSLQLPPLVLLPYLRFHP